MLCCDQLVILHRSILEQVKWSKADNHPHTTSCWD